ncbi:cytochrome c3 family protein [Campylobacter geochelonis]|uniref:cytochrome c3 family protein n=1 Tax=Campylobacter geochelonis TaxID=1780362 RepID=UPI0007707DB9|nr:NapC/NirT family cytochrome c [Campylobacter geochelonis]CZE51092.1 NapC/NirT cytochrome C family%2C N-region [Campylobacter geochelonis]
MKKRKFMILLAGVILGVVFAYGGYKAVKLTGDLPFCASCHVMEPMAVSYHNDVHSGIGESGVKASCTSCHLPHDNVVNYIFTKAKTGLYELGVTALGKDKDVDWYKKLENRSKFTYDTGCMDCHEKILDKKTSKHPKELEMHAHYVLLKGTKDEISCTTCHTHVGHNGLRGELRALKPEF